MLCLSPFPSIGEVSKLMNDAKLAVLREKTSIVYCLLVI